MASCSALESSSFVTAGKSDGLYGLSSGKVVTDTSSAAIGFGAAETSPASRFTCQSPGARKLKPLPRTVLGAEPPLDEPPPPHADNVPSATRAHAPATIRERERGYTESKADERTL